MSNYEIENRGTAPKNSWDWERRVLFVAGIATIITGIVIVLGHFGLL